MSRHTLRPVRMMHGGWAVVMGHVRGLPVPVMMMSVLPLVLLESHQAVARVQIRAASEVVRVFVNVGMSIAVEMPVDVAFRRRRLVMMLIRIQDLLNILQFIFAGSGLLWR